VRRILATFPHGAIEQWADITLAARERHGETFFKRSPQAYFLDNLKAAAAGTPPDWWRELRKQERELERQQEASKAQLFASPVDDEGDFEQYIPADGSPQCVPAVHQSTDPRPDRPRAGRAGRPMQRRAYRPHAATGKVSAGTTGSARRALHSRFLS
jgi:hypothetical protein